MRTVAAALAAVLAVGAAASGWTAYALRPPQVRTVTHTVTVTRTAPPVVRTKIRWRTRTVTVPTGSAADTNCIAALWRSYVSLASGGPAGDTSVFQADCPGVHINGLTY
jgi:hypothetical protein